MAIKTKGTLASDLASILTNGGLLTAVEDRGMRTDFIDSLACLLGTNSFVGNQDITGTLDVSSTITNAALTANTVLSANGSKAIESLPLATYPSLADMAALKGINDAWTAVAFDAGMFASDVGTWVVELGDVELFRYKIVGKTMYISLSVATSTTGTTPGYLIVALPGGATAKNTSQYNFGMYGNASTYEEAVITTVASANTLQIYRYNSVAFPNGTNDQSIRFTIVIEIE